jgi:Xaa-Pro dipeptidase
MLSESTDNLKPVYISRMENLSAAMSSAGLKAMILNPGPSLVYLTGLHFHLSERPVMAIFIPHEPTIFILPEFEAGKIDSAPFEVSVFSYPEDPSSWAGITKRGLLSLDIDRGPIGVEPRGLRYLELSLLQEAVQDLTYISAEDILASLRMYKDEQEIETMQKAVIIAQNALLATTPYITIGKSEKEIASRLLLELFHAGSEVELAFSPIVSGGPNSANPHATPSSRKLASGDLLVIDWGASHNGYFSDITRTFAIGEIDQKLENIANIVKEANEAARSIVRPGIQAMDVDKAARSIIETAGYGEFFLHRTGHGLGLEGHEEPYIRGDNDLILREGMTFTIEPGIYLPGEGGVRIEDNVYVTRDGCKSLTNLPRELFRVI